MNKTVKIILGVVVVALIAAGSFYGGMVFGKQQATATAAAVPMNFPEGFQPPDGATSRLASEFGTVSFPPTVAPATASRPRQSEHPAAARSTTPAAD